MYSVFLALFLFLIFPFSANGGETVSFEAMIQGYDEDMTCQDFYDTYNCAEKIKEAGPGRRKDFIDCSSQGGQAAKKVAGCGFHFTLGAGMAALTVVAPAVVLPIVGSLSLYGAIKSDQECYHNTALKRKMARPLEVLHGKSYSETLVKRLSCSELSRRVLNASRIQLGRIHTKQLEQERYLKNLKRLPHRQQQLQRRFPESKRLLTKNEQEFLATMNRIKQEENEFKSVVQRVNESFRCSSAKVKINAFCGMLGGIATGGNLLVSKVTEKSIQAARKVKPLSKQALEFRAKIDAAENASVGRITVGDNGRFNLFSQDFYEPDSLYIGVGNHPLEGSHHYYLVAGNKRYDGRMKEPSEKKTVTSYSTLPQGIVFKVDVPEEQMQAITNAIDKHAGNIEINCVHGACKVLKDAEIKLPGVMVGGAPMRLRPTLAGILDGDLAIQGQRVGPERVQMVATSQQQLVHFLREMDSVENYNRNRVLFIGTVRVGTSAALGYAVYEVVTEP